MPDELSMTVVFSWVRVSLPYVFGLLLVAYILLGGVLDYHWRRFGTGMLDSLKLRATYITVGIILFGSLAVTYMRI